MVIEKALRKPRRYPKAIFLLLFVSILLGLVFRGFSGIEPAQAAPSEKSPEILVGLFKCQEISVSLLSNYDMVAFASGPLNGKSETPFPKGSQLTFRVVESGIECTSPSPLGPLPSAGATCIILSALEESSIAEISGGFKVTGVKGGIGSLEGTAFPGNLSLILDNGGIIVANLLDIESYVASVVSSEMPYAFPLEAKKAQAIAARTYALYKMGIASFDQSRSLTAQMVLEKPYTSKDVRITAEDQVYRGFYGIDPSGIEATELTKGQVLTYQGKIVPCYYHADAAGMTEDVKYVWGGSHPCLKGVAEVPHVSPHSYWQVSYSQDEFSSLMGKINMAGPVSAIDVLDPGVSGRWGQVSIEAAGARVFLKPSEFRSVTGLKSMLFSLYRVGGNNETRGILSTGLTVQVQGLSSTVVRKAKDLVAEDYQGRKTPQVKAIHVVAPPRQGPGTYVFQGQGYGHGVGMSQWGAKAMADQGMDAKEILTHYYQGVLIEKRW